jgi:hypothetical protein
MDKLDAQTPAQGILLQSDWGDSKLYKIVCECGCDAEHNLHIEAEESGLIWVRIYAKVKTSYWREFWPKKWDYHSHLATWLDWTIKDFINGLATRIKLTWTIWTRGYIECEQDIALTRQQALNYSETLKSAIQEVNNFQNSKL